MAELSSDSRRKMLSIIRSKACKRCGGDLSVECDIYGVYIECIQCGATFNKNDLALTNTRDAEHIVNVVKAKPLTTISKPKQPA